MRKYLMDSTQNCLQCCLAGMFDLERSDVPGVHAWSKEGYWFDGLYEWSKKKLKHTVVTVTDDTLDDLFHIAVIAGKDTEFGHAVIAYGQTVVWDPLPIEDERATNLEGLIYSLVFVPISGLSVQHACRMSFINDWTNATAAMHKSITMELNDG